MRIKFSGVWDDVPYADDRGSIDIWLLQHIKEVIEQGPETDDIYEKLQLSWETIDAN